MIKFDDVANENIKEHNPIWPQISDHSFRILMIRESWSGKTMSSFNLINQEPDINKKYLCAKDRYEAKHQSAKDRYEAKHQILIIKRESTGLKHLNDSKAFVQYSNDMDDIYKILKNTTK